MSLDAPTPKLTRLELHGFKSFASRTVFAFEPGITAIVGPNGSGKSNVSDAVRWVLGETSYNALRGKRTDDVIFAGGHGRAPAGMAEATLTFNNETSWLQTPFTEVSVTRRAFRGGENQYLINGRRVRLKDVAQLTASLGQSYTVVGQGLVDAALSQRAEERRGLFEHAADLTGLRLKVAEAERSLNETEANSLRLTDLLGEIEPHLKSLERAARQATEWRGVHERLRTLQRTHYRQLLTTARDRVTTAARDAETAAAHAEQARRESERNATVAMEGRLTAEAARAALARHDAQLQAALDTARRVGHERDLTAERYTALTRRREDMADTQAGLDEQVASVAGELTSLTAELATVETEVAAAQSTVSALQAEGDARRGAQTEREREVATLTTALRDQERRAADLARRRALLEQRQETSLTERARATVAAEARATRIAVLVAELAGVDAAAGVTLADLTRIDQRLSELATAIDAATIEAQIARAAVDAAERELNQATTRLEVLRRLDESGTGLHAGVRQVTQWSRAGAMEGIRGTVSELIEVPARYDTAVEVALGGHLQDIVVERWVDAEAAIARLKAANAGRATFLPLDVPRDQSRRAPPASVLAETGVEGIAATLVSAPTDLAEIVTAILGRTIIVDELATARRMLAVSPVGWSAVTLSGEIARGGSVTGGAAPRESGVLGRARGLRDLPKRVQHLTHAREAAVVAWDTASAAPEALLAERRTRESERAGLLASQTERRHQRDRLASWLAELETEHAAADGGRDRLVATLAALEGDIAQLRLEETALSAETERSEVAHAGALTDLDRERNAAIASERTLTAAQRRLATLEERLRAERRRQTSLLAQRHALAEELALRAERAAALDGERTALASQRERLTREAARLEDARSAIAAARDPLERDARRADTESVRAERAIEAARALLLERERAHGTAELAVERSQGDLALLDQRIVDELGMEDPAELLAEPSRELDESPRRDPAEVEREIGRLKERLRRVGYVGEDAVADYEREAAHQAFLRAQLTDVQDAAATLRRILAELRMTMGERFATTFAQVATAFTEAFQTLFGGGTARLVLATTDDGASAGIDIVAQPPGKRLQNLALLSGGERALTAAALLFAILRVNPSPFVLLDEVDAALDEANIERFRDALAHLSRETQAILITHNRGTIESADTLYGVTMAADGVSQVLSLRLAEAVAG
ncbi:MAG: chromosome segregation protein SMC [Chloroflexota bacterium]|nr:chromosome segregation protein SMC [Chloroflexota bacterium]